MTANSLKRHCRYNRICVSLALTFLIDSKRNASQIRSAVVRTACMIDNRYPCSCNDAHLWDIAPSCIHIMQISIVNRSRPDIFQVFPRSARRARQRLYKKNGSQHVSFSAYFDVASLSFFFSLRFNICYCILECFDTRKNGSGFYKNAPHAWTVVT